MIYINNNPEGFQNVELGDDYIKHSDGMLSGVHFENLTFTDDSEGEEVKQVRLNYIRKKRDKLLTQTDYLVLPDYPIDETELSLWSAYRQALRDMPETVDIDNIVWPIPPNEQEPELEQQPEEDVEVSS